MKILITGGAGFIGSHTAEELLKAGARVRVYDNLSSGKRANLRGLDAEFIKGDIRDKNRLRAAVKGVDRVLHLAALVSVADSVLSPERSHDINATGTFNVFEAARLAGVKRVVAASSAAVYGNAPALPKKETMAPMPESPYGVGKLLAEYYAGVYWRLYGLETVCLRYFNVYGPRQDASSPYSGVISRFGAALAGKKDLTVYGDGRQTRDFVSVKDVAAANVSALLSAKAGKGEVFNIGTGRATSLLALIKIISDLCSVRAEVRFKPRRAGDIRHSLSDISLAARQLGYRPRYTVKQGLGLMFKETPRYAPKA
jgi:UDP-glucose 4-epimerase